MKELSDSEERFMIWLKDLYPSNYSHFIKETRETCHAAALMPCLCSQKVECPQRSLANKKYFLCNWFNTDLSLP